MKCSLIPTNHVVKEDSTYDTNIDEFLESFIHTLIDQCTIQIEFRNKNKKKGKVVAMIEIQYPTLEVQILVLRWLYKFQHYFHIKVKKLFLGFMSPKILSRGMKINI